MSKRVAANLVIGADGSTTRGGSSRGLSFEADRQRFHQLRGGFDVILIGGNTARNEPYSRTPIPLIVLTHGGLPKNMASNPLAQAWGESLEKALPRATRTFGDVLIEAGPSLVRQGLEQGLISELFLTISDAIGGENLLKLSDLLKDMVEISREEPDGGHFVLYRLAPSHR